MKNLPNCCALFTSREFLRALPTTRQNSAKTGRTLAHQRLSSVGEDFAHSISPSPAPANAIRKPRSLSMVSPFALAAPSCRCARRNVSADQIGTPLTPDSRRQANYARAEPMMRCTRHPSGVADTRDGRRRSGEESGSNPK